MQMKKIVEEKGSMAVYVGIVLFSFLIIISSIYMSAMSSRKSQLRTILRVKESYEADNDNAEAIYETQLKKVTTRFDFTGNLQTFTAPRDGIYLFEVTGASGSEGNKYGKTSLTSIGGKGAKITATFSLSKGDLVDLVIGGQGSCTQATVANGTSGGGGGGSFVFKRINTITNSNYQFTKGSINYETLLAVAGGSGSQDVGYTGANSTAPNGQALNYKSPNNYTAYSTITNAGTASTAVNGTMGISQFISYDAKGSFYTLNNGRSQGGYGGGGSQDNTYSYGGGWCNGSSSYQATSWSLDTSAIGKDGDNTGNGYAIITWLRTE